MISYMLKELWIELDNGSYINWLIGNDKILNGEV
jgi:hypothetical protein